MRGRHFIVVAFALLAIAIVAGCGSDDNDGTASAAGSKAEFKQQANAVCKETIAEIQAGGERLYNKKGGPGEEAEFGRRLIAEVLVPSFEKQIQEIQQVGIPSSEEVQINALFTAISQFLRQLETDPGAEEFYPYKKAEAIADKSGLRFCGRPSA